MDSSWSAGHLTGSTLATPCSLNFSLDGQFGIWHIVILLFWLVCRVVGLVGELNLLTWLLSWFGWSVWQSHCCFGWSVALLVWLVGQS